MIHLAVAIVAVSLTCATLVVLAFVVPDAPRVSASFITGTCFALVLSGTLLWYVRSQRL